MKQKKKKKVCLFKFKKRKRNDEKNRMPLFKFLKV